MTGATLPMDTRMLTLIHRSDTGAWQLLKLGFSLSRYFYKSINVGQKLDTEQNVMMLTLGERRGQGGGEHHRVTKMATSSCPL